MSNRSPSSIDATRPTLPDLSGLDAGDAEWLAEVAASKRAGAIGTSPTHRAQLEGEAAGLEALAAALRDPVARELPVLKQGKGGEITVTDDADLPWCKRELVQVVGSTPSMLAADGSLARLTLARNSGALTSAIEAAQDAGAETAIEKMIAHQIAAGHAVAMKLMTNAGNFAAGIQSWDTTGRQQVQSIEAARMATAAARMMEACTRAALTLDRLRNGARQTVVVQRVDVAAGGQMMVAGAVNAGGDRRSDR